MKKIAIVISTQKGHTEKIAEYMTLQLACQSSEVHIFNVPQHRGPLADDLKDYDAVIVGCPVYLGDFPQELLDWTWDRHEQLSSMPTGFFTVSLNAADPRPKARLVDDKVLSKFLNQTDFHPWFVASFAGALAYTKYGFFKKCVMQSVSAAAGGPTDMSKDFDLTNWFEVSEFVEALNTLDLSSQFATVNRLPMTPKPSWPMGMPRVA